MKTQIQEVPRFSSVGTVQAGVALAPAACSAEIVVGLTSWLRLQRKSLVDDRELPVSWSGEFFF